MKRSIKKRYKRLENLLKELKSESFDDQYQIADFLHNGKMSERMDKLAAESSFYQAVLKNLPEKDEQV